MEQVANETVTLTKFFLLSNRKWWTVTDASCHAKSQLLLKHNETNKLTRRRDKRVQCSDNLYGLYQDSSSNNTHFCV